MASLLRLSVLAASATQVLASCAYGTHIHPRAAEGASVEVKNFTYSGLRGPLNWVALDTVANTACGTGRTQSPIDMVAGAFNVLPGSSLNINIPDFAQGTEFENLGTTVEVIAKGGTMAVGGTQFALQQFHFHLPSEHLDNGTSMAMEMHMVWQSAAQQIAVIGVYIEVEQGGAAVAPVAGAPVVNATAEAPAPAAGRRAKRWTSKRESAAKAAANPLPVAPVSGIPAMSLTPVVATASTPSTLLETVLSNVGKIATPGTVTKTQPLVMSELVTLLSAGTFQSYMGSLTTPPCSEGVQWLVSTQKLRIQPATFNAARDVIGFNSRFPQNTLGQPNILQIGSQSIAGAAAVGRVATIPAPP